MQDNLISLRYGVEGQFEKEADCLVFGFARALDAMIEHISRGMIGSNLDNPEYWDVNYLENCFQNPQIKLGTWADGNSNVLANDTPYALHEPWDTSVSDDMDGAGVTVELIDNTPDSYDVKISEQYTNNTGADITVKSISLMSNMEVDYSGWRNVLLARDIFGSFHTATAGTSNVYYYKIRIKSG